MMSSKSGVDGVILMEGQKADTSAWGGTHQFQNKTVGNGGVLNRQLEG